MGDRLGTYWKSSLLLFSALLSTGCAGKNKQKAYANYLLGRVNFANALPVQAGTPIVVEYSTNAFATVTGRTIVNNDLGMLSVPYRLDFLEEDGDFVQLRAFQDNAHNLTWTAGDPSGRFNRSADPNAPYTTIARVVGYVCPPGYSDNSSGSGDPCTANFFSSYSTSSDGDTYHFFGVDIYMDSSTSQ